MAIKLTKKPNITAFVGNGLFFTFTSDTRDKFDIVVETYLPEKLRNRLTLTPYGKNPPYIATVDISDIVASSLPEDNEIKEGGILREVWSLGNVYRVWDPDMITFYFGGEAYRGGVDDDTFSFLASYQLDIFSYRLLSKHQNWLYTTRTHSRVFRIKETELYPIPFKSRTDDIGFESESGNRISPEIGWHDYALDIKALRDEFLLTYNELPDTIQVLVEGDRAFTIVVEPGAVSEERYLIRFRNSLGVFEVIEVTGVALNTPEASEENSWKTLTEYGFFEQQRERITMRKVIEVQTGYKSREEQSFILDMAASDEIYFIYPENGYSFRCNVTIDNPSYRHRMVSPNSMLLKVTAKREMKFITPQPDISIIESYGIFDESFDYTFN